MLMICEYPIKSNLKLQNTKRKINIFNLKIKRSKFSKIEKK